MLGLEARHASEGQLVTDMALRLIRKAKGRYPLPLVALNAVACGALALIMPSAGLALTDTMPARASASMEALGIGRFTPATVDPELAARVAGKARERGIHFTPASAPPISGKRTVTVAVRLDDDTAQIVSVRKLPEVVPGRGLGLAGMDANKFQLGAARGVQSFARTIDLSANVRTIAAPDLAQFEPSKPKSADKPSRLQPQVEFEDRAIAGRSPNTLDSVGQENVDVGGSFRLSRNLNVMAGVRYSKERDRLDPLTNSVKDSQAVYVGTQIKF
jgi:hypothetical protein